MDLGLVQASAAASNVEEACLFGRSFDPRPETSPVVCFQTPDGVDRVKG